MLLVEPGSEIDEPAAIAAEGAIDRFRRPLHGALAGRAFDDRHHGNPRTLGAARQKKRHVHFHVYGAAGGIQPVQKSNSATMLAAADLGKQLAVGGQGHTHQLARILAVKL